MYTTRSLKSTPVTVLSSYICRLTMALIDKGHHLARGTGRTWMKSMEEEYLIAIMHGNRHRIQGNSSSCSPLIFFDKDVAGYIYGVRPDSIAVESALCMYGPRGRRCLEEHRSENTSEECQRQQQRCHRGWLLLIGVFPPKDVVETIGRYRVPLRTRSESSKKRNKRKQNDILYNLRWRWMLRLNWWSDGNESWLTHSLTDPLDRWRYFQIFPWNLDNLGSSITSWPTDRDACSQGGVGICSETSCIAQKMDPSATPSISSACSQPTFALLNQRWYPFQ